MRALLAASLLALPLMAAACPGCSSPASNPDAAVDARPIDAGDAGRCPGELFFTGDYVDWDSTLANFHGIAFATFAIEGDSTAAHMDQSSPNGRIEMCIPPSGRALIKVTSMAGDTHIPGHFIADAAVFASGRVFSTRGITAARAPTFFTDQGLTYDSGKAMLLVQQQGTPVALTLTGATAEKTLSSPDGITWAPGTTDKYALFANITVTGTPHLAGPAIGAGDLPMQAGEVTMTTVVAQ